MQLQGLPCREEEVERSGWGAAILAEGVQHWSNLALHGREHDYILSL